MVELQRQGQIIQELDRLWNQLLMGAPHAQRSLSFNLYQAALAVAVQGIDEIPDQLAACANNWRAGKLRSNADETQRFRTVQPVERSEKPGSRTAAGGSANEEVAKEGGISPATNKRGSRKPKK
jgi:hypothetical protein